MRTFLAMVFSFVAMMVAADIKDIMRKAPVCLQAQMENRP